MTVPRVRHDRLTVLAIVLLVAVLVAACNSASPTPSPEPSPTASPPNGAVSPPPSEAPAALPSSEPTAADPVYDEIEQEVAALRGLQPTASAPQDARRGATRRGDGEALSGGVAARAGRRERALLQGPRPAPPDASLGDLTVEMLSGGVAGFYRDDQKTLYVVSRSGEVGANEKVTFAHEFDHALQDQHFTIFKDQEGVTDRSDWLLARQALYEGDASLLMTLWMSENFTPEEFQELLGQGLNDPSTEMLERMPAILRETLLYPYTTGLTFAQGQYISGGGWAGVDALYANVPETTEQVLHPEKYQAGEGPVEIDVPRRLRARGSGPTGTLALDDTFGEFQTGVWLRDAGGGECHRGGRGLGRGPGARARRPGRRVGDRAGHGMGHARRMRRSSRQSAGPVGRGAGRSGRAAPRRDGHRPLGRGRERRRRARGGRRTRSAWRARSRRPRPYIESGAEIPSSPSALASVILVASASASRFAERSGSSGSTTRASR